MAGLPAWADDGVRLGETYRGVVQLKTYGSPQVPLPPGDWKLVGLDETRSASTNIRLVTGVLAQGANGVFSGAVIFTVPDSPSRGGWARLPLCDRKAIPANFSLPATSESSYDCLTIEPINVVRSPTSGKSIAQLFDYIEASKLKKPASNLSVTFGLASGGTYLVAAYLFNPDLEKIAPVSSASWHLDRYKEDPKRAAYIDRLKAWAQQWRPTFADGLKGKLPASFSAAPVFPVTKAAPVAGPVKGLEKPLAQVAEVGRSYRDILPLNILGAPQIPLPPGEWKLVVLDELETEKSKVRLVRGYLLQTQGKTMAGQIYFLAPDGALPQGWKSTNCPRKDSLVNLTRDAGSNQGYDCSFITSYATTLPNNATPQLQRFHDYLSQNSIEAPPTMLAVAYDISDKKTYLITEYRFNPALEGVRADSVAAWRPQRIGEDSQRAAYIEKMKTWAHTWHAKIEAGYKSALPKAAALN